MKKVGRKAYALRRCVAACLHRKRRGSKRMSWDRQVVEVEKCVQVCKRRRAS